MHRRRDFRRGERDDVGTVASDIIGEPFKEKERSIRMNPPRLDDTIEEVSLLDGADGGALF